MPRRMTSRHAKNQQRDPLSITLAQHFLKTRPFKMRSWIGFAPPWRGDVGVAYAFLDWIRIQENESQPGQDCILRFIEIPIIGAFKFHSDRKIIASDSP